MPDPVDERLAGLRCAALPPLAPAHAVRARGEQRRARARRAVGAGLTAVAVLGGMAWAASSSSRPDSLEPAPFASTATDRTSPAPSSAPSSASSSAASTSWTLAEAFLPPESAAAAEQPGWSVRVPHEPQAGPLADPCEQHVAPLPEQVVASAERSMGSEREAGGSSLLQELYRYSSVAAAEEAFRLYTDRYHRCARVPDPNGPDGTTLEAEVVDLQERPGGARLVVRRIPCTEGHCTEHFSTYVLVVWAEDALTAVGYAIAEDGDPAKEAASLALAVERHLRGAVGR